MKNLVLTKWKSLYKTDISSLQSNFSKASYNTFGVLKKWYFKNECESFIGVSKHEKTDESMTPYAECFYCFQVFGNTDETQSTSFWNSFSIETKIK